MNDASNFPENEQPEAKPLPHRRDRNHLRAGRRHGEHLRAGRDGGKRDRLRTGAACARSAVRRSSRARELLHELRREDRRQRGRNVSHRPPRSRAQLRGRKLPPQRRRGQYPPRYYTPNDDAWAEKPKHKHRPRKPRTARTPEQKRLITRIACLCLVCALLGGLGGGAVAGSSTAPAGPAAAPPPLRAAHS